MSTKALGEQLQHQQQLGDHELQHELHSHHQQLHVEHLQHQQHHADELFEHLIESDHQQLN